MTTTIYLFRHGETDWNKEKRFMGQTQIALNDKGKEQALKLAQRVKKLSLVKLYSSDLLRTKQTAEIIATEIGSDIEYDPRFREIDGGLCTGLRIAEMRDKYRSWWQEKRKFTPGVEVMQAALKLQNHYLKWKHMRKNY